MTHTTHRFFLAECYGPRILTNGLTKHACAPPVEQKKTLEKVRPYNIATKKYHDQDSCEEPQR